MHFGDSGGEVRCQRYCIKKVSNNVTVQLNKLIYNAYTYEQLFSPEIVVQ